MLFCPAPCYGNLYIRFVLHTTSERDAEAEVADEFRARLDDGFGVTVGRVHVVILRSWSM